jgi:hypothetical protein
MPALIGRCYGWLRPVTQMLRLPAWKILGEFGHGAPRGYSHHSNKECSIRCCRCGSTPSRWPQPR